MQRNILIRVEHLRRVYGSVVAVDDVSFEVKQGEIFGIVGPNGAGKTTTIECIEGLRQSNSGYVEVLGLDPQRDEYELRSRIGVQLQESKLPNRIKVWEALDLFASFYPQSIPWQTLLIQLGLEDSFNTPFTKLSGGQKQRLFIALALINDPELVFLDELTTGLDPQARRAMWNLVQEIRNNGKTVFFTTHFMEEAERLCDRLAVIDHGQIVALDSPEKLIQSIGAESRVVFIMEENIELHLTNLNNLPSVTSVEPIGERIVVYGHDKMFVSEVVNYLVSKSVHFRDLRTEQPTLEDVFLSLTGREMRN